MTGPPTWWTRPLSEVVLENALEIRLAGPGDRAAAHALRHEVFVAGQGIDPAIERDGRDDDATHVVAVDHDRVVGTGRLVVRPDRVGQVGRMAVRPDTRGRGVGTRVLAELERVATDLGLRGIELGAQLTARGFYDRLGYAPAGDVYTEAGLEHVTMRRPLPVVRPVRDADSAALIRLIGDCWGEYPGCVLDVDAEEPWLRAPASAYRDWSARMWVAAFDWPDPVEEVVGCVGIKPIGAGVVELKSLYVAKVARRRGLGGRLVGLVEEEARRRDAARVALWSDTRFLDAHRLYEGHGYRRTGRSRDLGDLSNTTEVEFVTEL